MIISCTYHLFTQKRNLWEGEQKHDASLTRRILAKLACKPSASSTRLLPDFGCREELTTALLSHSSIPVLGGQAARSLALLRDSGRNVSVKRMPKVGELSAKKVCGENFISLSK